MTSMQKEVFQMFKNLPILSHWYYHPGCREIEEFIA
jgi:hypothetical protein